MRLRTIYVRFYRAFNFDFLRKTHPDVTPHPWDVMDDGNFYPYVSVDLDLELTSIVGANESGKSQLLDAIEYGLGIRQPDIRDFCRYSTYFTVAEAPKQPHFGLHFVDLLDEESNDLKSIIDSDKTAKISSFRMFRTSLDRLSIYVDEEDEPYEIDDSDAMRGLLPKVSRIDPKRALPDSVPLSYLVQGGNKSSDAVGTSRLDWRRQLSPILDNIPSLAPLYEQDDKQPFLDAVQPYILGTRPPATLSDRERQQRIDERNLALDLLVSVGRIHSDFFEKLQEALDRSDQGLAKGIVREMNRQLAAQLNLAKWWTQDTAFGLALEAGEFDLTFTIQDRTGSNFSFSERSDGLRYFLSYLIQFLTHLRNRRDFEILLMDEPDAYLSNQGQQDLLRLLQEFTVPTDTTTGGQVIFVTHSPFLIDKNRADRIRVLDKGIGKEGVRVVRDVARNHFEPLRTALGGFVGETVFISNCNLIIEGIADQVYLAGMSTVLSQRDAPANSYLNLNSMTLVPAGGASQVPYMTYLARGRDADKPAVVVFIDGDEEGNRAVKELQRGGPRDKRLLHERYIVQLKPGLEGLTSDHPGGPLSIEDLIPVSIVVDAVRAYATEMGFEPPDADQMSLKLNEALAASDSILDAVQVSLDEMGVDISLAKLAFARHAVQVCASDDTENGRLMRNRFAALFASLTPILDEAWRERQGDSIAQRFDRDVERFLRDYDHRQPTRADLSALLDRLVDTIDDSIEGEEMLASIRLLRLELELDRDQHLPIDDMNDLKSRLTSMKYAEMRASQSVST